MAEPTAAAPDREHLQRNDPHSYWGYLFKANKCPSPKLVNLLKGIAASISQTFHPHDSNDLTPKQLAAYFRSVGGNYDHLFLDMHPGSIAQIYTSLGCLHSLQPDLGGRNGQYRAPCIPALKPAGFVTWQMIQILLGPDEHVPYVQNALRQFDIEDPETKTPFPKDLPRAAFPTEEDQDMVQWYKTVSIRLRAEAQEEVEQQRRQQYHSAPAGHDETRQQSRPTSASSHEETLTSGDERTDAAHYFSNPWIYRNRDGRPQVVRTFSKTPGRVLQGGKAVALTARNTVKNVFDPHLWSGSGSGSGSQQDHRRRRSAADLDSRSRERESSLPPGTFPARHAPPHSHARHASALAGRHPREHDYPDDRHAHFAPSPMRSARDSPRVERPRRWDRDESSSDGDNSPDRRNRSHRQVPSPLYRRHRSQEAPSSPRGYFDDWERTPRTSSAHSSAFSPKPTSSGSTPTRSHSHRHPQNRSPLPQAARRYSAEDEEIRRAKYERRREQASSSEHGSPVLSGAVPPSMNPAAFAQSQPLNQQRQPQPGYVTAQGRAPIDPRPEARSSDLYAGGTTVSASSTGRYKHSSSLHPDEAARRRLSINSNEGSSSPSGDAEGEYDSTGKERPPRRATTGEAGQGTPRGGTPVAGVSGRRYPAEVPWVSGTSGKGSGST